MKNIVIFIFTMIFLSVVLSAALFFWKAKEYYLPKAPVTAADYLQDYDLLKNIALSEQPPALPDISIYTLALLQARTPEFQNGVINVELLKKASPELRGDIAQYSDMQERLDPLSIYISSGVVGMRDIVAQLEDVSLVEEHLDNSFTLHVPLIVSADATLLIQKGETILMSATEGAFLSVQGNGFIDGATIIGWDVLQDTPAEFSQADIFRPYIYASCGAALDIAESSFAHLGYQAKNAVGLAYASCKEQPDVPSAKGGIIANNFEGLYTGFVADNATDIVLIDNDLINNIDQGIELRNGTHHTIIANNKVSGTIQNNAIMISGAGDSNFILGNVLENNAGSGIYITNNSAYNLLAQNKIRENAQDGISIYESPDNILRQNIIEDNKGSGLRVRNSWHIKSYQDSFEGNKDYPVQLYAQSLIGRDMVKDPYLEEAGLSLRNTQIISRSKAVFKAENFDVLEMTNLNIVAPSSKIFTGDLKEIGADIFEEDVTVMLKKKVRY